MRPPKAKTPAMATRIRTMMAMRRLELLAVVTPLFLAKETPFLASKVVMGSDDDEEEAASEVPSMDSTMVVSMFVLSFLASYGSRDVLRFVLLACLFGCLVA